MFSEVMLTYALATCDPTSEKKELSNIAPMAQTGSHCQLPSYYSGTGSFGVRQVQVAQTSEVAYVAPSAQLSAVRELLGLNVSDLASLLGTSRPTIYAWRDGQEPTIEHQRKLFALYKLSQQAKVLEIQRMETFVKRPIFNGLSLLDLIRGEEDISQQLRDIQSLSAAEAISRSARKGSVRIYSDSDDTAIEASGRD